MPDNLLVPAVMLLVLAFMGWFVVGTQWNVRQGDRVLKWLRQGLPLVGERSTMRWLGSSVVELKMAKAKDPFRTAETLIVFEPRDVAFLWAWARLRGRRDLLIFRSQLRSAPTFEMEVFDPHGWTAPNLRQKVKEWTPLDLSAMSSMVGYYSGNLDPQVAKRLVDTAARSGGKLMRVSVHRSVPNLEVHWLLPNPGTCSARDLFLKVRQLSEEAVKQ